MTNFVNYRGGAPVLNSEYEMSNALTSQHCIEEKAYKWQDAFWKKVFDNRGQDIPMPVMVGNKPYWGGVYPPENIEVKNGRRYIADFKCKIYTAPDHDVRLPDDDEFKLHFKKIINNYKLCKIKNSHRGVILIRK
jgi:hypothetical protein